jgi:polyvinyl alcohol dehydrogenase (cytochrome)
MKTNLISCLFVIATVFQTQAATTWPTAGQNRNNTRANESERTITPANVSRLAVKWQFTTGGDVSATPAVDQKAVYFPDWGGKLHSLDRASGSVIWSKRISEYTGVADSVCRATPAISGNTLIIGTQLDSSRQGADVLAIDKRNGALLWRTKVHHHPSAIITQSAVIYNGRIFVGVASAEEAFATDPAYACCSFRGSMLSLNLADGQILWKTEMTPADKGFSGVAAWGSTPVIDPSRNSVFIATGNNYTVPQAILDCMSSGGNSQQIRDCVMSVDGSAENYFDSVMALDLDSGAVKWVNSRGCIFEPNVNCPDPKGPDYDFGQGPALFTLKSKRSGGQELLGAGQKSGVYWTFNPDTGQNVWATEVGPGATLGGLEWGSAVADGHIYTAVANGTFAPVTFTVGPQIGRTVKGGFWSALDARTGKILWQVAGDQPPAIPTDTTPIDAIAINTGPVSTANGVVFAGALDAIGTMYALDGATGNILWSFVSGGSVNSSPAIVDGVVYWGSGYKKISHSQQQILCVRSEVTHQFAIATVSSRRPRRAYKLIEGAVYRCAFFRHDMARMPAPNIWLIVASSGTVSKVHCPE